MNNTSAVLAAPTAVTETAGSVYELVGRPRLDWWQAAQYCEERFAQLVPKTQASERTALLTILHGHQVPAPDLFADTIQDFRNDPSPHPRVRRLQISSSHCTLCHVTLRQTSVEVEELKTLPALVFSSKTATRYARVLVDFPELPAVTACAHIQWDTSSQEVATIFSYAVPAFNNELQLRGFADQTGSVYLALIVHGHHSPYLPAFQRDGHWHHICLTWEQRRGNWALFADGKHQAEAEGLSANQPIYAQGVFIVGQDQDSLGGSFRETESFSGNITGLHIWGRVLDEAQLERVWACVVPERELIFRWDSRALEIEATVQELSVQLVCPGPVEECPVLDGVSGEPGFVVCLKPLPFICSYQKDMFHRLKHLQSPFGRAFIRRVNSLANATVLLEDIFAEGSEILRAVDAISFLGVLQQVLESKGKQQQQQEEEEEEGGKEPVLLQSADLLSVVQFLKRVSGIEVEGRESAGTLEQLSQRFVAVTSLVLAEQNTAKWLEISEIVRGPMILVESMTRLVSNLSPLLMAERAKVTVQHQDVGFEARNINLSQAAERDIYRPLAGLRGGDRIEICSEEIKGLQKRGLSRVTVINTWFGYGALQRSLGQTGHPVMGQSISVTDGGQKYLQTKVGSALISSLLLSDFQELNSAVQYHLLHRVQDLPNTLVEPICAFWNFRGAWSSVGCSVEVAHQDSTSCSCNHSTNFAVLLQVYEVQRSLEEESMLKTLTFIGCGVSFCALIITFVLFLAVGVPKSERTTVHKNLIFALAVAEALLMFSEWAKTNKVACFTVTALLHLFFLAAFAWMLVEGLLLWSKVVAVNMSEDRRMVFYYMTGWGLPVIIVGITLAISFNEYVADTYCWLNVQTDIIWAFVGPVLFVLMVNAFILIRVVVITVSSARRRSRMLTPKYNLEKQIGIQIWATAKPVLVLLPVLGLTWLCGMLVHVSVAWAYVFITLNSLQGLYIFLVYAIYNTEVRNAIQRIKEKKKALSFTAVELTAFKSSDHPASPFRVLTKDVRCTCGPQ
ncbi:adhesion G-protein coupled receptor D2 [Ornithorhynchus anatinus]|uniref:adhesion G-protein coupled receptor D2 n=1 Tax=Ornithorhynchus anatinus TaxID=9258 RepID=UPI0019D4589C|nr:adhesion G-protein coupled receptor D2 [Ornithorhynchus anatinus]